jgi:hypothetical protein
MRHTPTRFHVLPMALLMFLLVLTLAVPGSAHVGSPDVFLQGDAGPYRLFVTVRVPQVIPGIAEIEIRSESNDVREIRVAPMQLTGPGSQYAPTPDVAQRSPVDPQFFTGSLWLMEFGSLQVRIAADGARGKGELAVPVPAVAQGTLPMQRSLGTLLFLLMLILALALISIAAAAVREGNLEPGADPSPSSVRSSRVAAGIAAFVVVALLYLGGAWWKVDADRYAANVYRPPKIAATFDEDGRLLLQQQATRMTSGNPQRPREWIDFSDLVPDHAHLMHLFLIRMPDMDSFWHMHPERTADGGFGASLPTVPPGRYQLFADVVLRNGFPITMTGQIDARQMRGKPLVGDDSGIVTSPISPDATDTTEAALPEGARMIWEREAKPFKSGTALILRFHVLDGQGKPAEDMQPYMGMAAHAVVIRSDASVFAHVHPAGSISMASFDLAQAGLPDNPVRGGMGSMAMPMETVSPEISFPYGFPKPGLYRIFVQIKRSGNVQTAVFEASVE